jgi:hypothetical protein
MLFSQNGSPPNGLFSSCSMFWGLNRVAGQLGSHKHVAWHSIRTMRLEGGMENLETLRISNLFLMILVVVLAAASFGPIYLSLEAAKDMLKVDSAHPGRHQSTVDSMERFDFFLRILWAKAGPCDMFCNRFDQAYATCVLCAQAAFGARGACARIRNLSYLLDTSNSIQVIQSLVYWYVLTKPCKELQPMWSQWFDGYEVAVPVAKPHGPFGHWYTQCRAAFWLRFADYHIGRPFALHASHLWNCTLGWKWGHWDSHRTE